MPLSCSCLITLFLFILQLVKLAFHHFLLLTYSCTRSIISFRQTWWMYFHCHKYSTCKTHRKKFSQKLMLYSALQEIIHRVVVHFYHFYHISLYESIELVVFSFFELWSPGIEREKLVQAGCWRTWVATHFVGAFTNYHESQQLYLIFHVLVSKKLY